MAKIMWFLIGGKAVYMIYRYKTEIKTVISMYVFININIYLRIYTCIYVNT